MWIPGPLAEHLRSREVGDAVLRSLEKLLSEDEYLLQVDANERAITHRLAMYLQEYWPEADVDCEYNRDGIDPKRIGFLDLQADTEDTDGRTVFPDIIVHQRGKARENYLVIELKKDTSGVDRAIDLLKLTGYRRALGYRHALFLELGTGPNAGIVHAEWVD